MHHLITAGEKSNIQADAKDMYLATALIQHADPKRFKKLQDELENDYTKGNDNYPKSVVKAYQLLNDFKSGASRADNTSNAGRGIAFNQHASKPQKKSAKYKDSAGQYCFQCGKDGFTIYTCPD